LSRPSLIAGVAIVWLGATAAAQTGIRASHAFSVLSSSVPLVLSAGEQVAVPITLRNEGLETWDSEFGFRLSYHWLSYRGSIVERDGVRTELPGRVKTGATVELEARLIAPDEAGLHRLQWDMVQEHVAWFSIRDPRTPRLHLVLIVPATNAGFSVVPALAAAIAGLGALAYARRRSWVVSPVLLALAGWSDVIWGTLSVWTKQWRLLTEADMPAVSIHLWVALATAAVGPLALAWVSRRWRPWFVWVMAALGTFVVLADLVYFRYFGDILSVPAVLAARQTGELGADIRSLLQPPDLWLVLDLVVAIPMLAAVARMPQAATGSLRGWRVMAAAVVLTVLPGATLAVRMWFTEPRAFRQTFRNMFLVQDLGLYGYHAHDLARFLSFSTLRPELTTEERQDVERWFFERGRGHGLERRKGATSS
jgi:hypothetical protein